MFNFYQERYKQTLQQTVRWFNSTGVTDKFSKPIFDPVGGANIKVRSVAMSRLITDREGKESITSTKIMTVDLVKKGDYIADAGETDYTKGKEVIHLHGATDPQGNEFARTVMI